MDLPLAKEKRSTNPSRFPFKFDLLDLWIFPLQSISGPQTRVLHIWTPQAKTERNYWNWSKAKEPRKYPQYFSFWRSKNPGDLIEPSADGIALDERWMPLKNEALVRFGHTLKDLQYDPADIASISWGFKRNLRTPDEQIIYNDRGTGSISLNGRIYERGDRYIEVGAIEKVGLYILFLLESFRENTGYLPTEAVFTYPAVFNRQKEALRKAIAWATQGMDLKPILDISEPEAIALDYALDIAKKHDLGRDIIYGVFDCGGGTTDISVVRLTPRKEGRPEIEILASDGDNDLGGDFAVFQNCARTV